MVFCSGFSVPSKSEEPKLKQTKQKCTISWVVDDCGEAVRPVSFHVKGPDLHLKLSHLEVFLSGNENGVFVGVTPCLRVRDGLVHPVVSVVRLKRDNVAKLLAVEIPWLHRLKVGSRKRENQLVLAHEKVKILIVSHDVRGYLLSM